MTKLQWSAIIAACVSVAVLYFACETTPVAHKDIEARRSLAAVTTDISNLLIDAKSSISKEDAAVLMALESSLDQAQEPQGKADAYQELSGKWYSLEKPSIAGYYAEKVAEIKKSAEAWGISGTTYVICVQRENDEKVKKYCGERAVLALEKAISLEPDNSQHKINLALVYADLPPENNPMAGIQMLLDMNKKDPQDVEVIVRIGRLAIKTGQYDRAIERLKRALELDPQNKSAPCFLYQAYSGLGDQAKAEEFKARCEQF